MAAYVAPILSEFETILKANLNTEIAAIDATAQPIDSTAYAKANTIMPNRFPWVSIFQLGEAAIEFKETGGTIYINFPIYVTVDIYGRDERRLHALADIYNTAIVEAVVSGGGGWCLNAVVDNLRLVAIGVTPVDVEEGNIIGGCYTRWECFKTIDPT